MEHNGKKKFAAILSVFSNSSLIVLKLISGIISGSVSVISEALHSLCDLLASFIAYFSIRKSSEPPDEEHPFGHGKFEDLAGFVEAILIIITALYILFIAGEKIIANKVDQIDTTLGICVMVISVVVNFFVSRYLYKIAKKTDSIALYTDAQHLSADIFSSVAVLAGLLAVKITNIHIIDPIFAIVVGILILRTGIRLTKEAMGNLVDSALPNHYEDKIRAIVLSINQKNKEASEREYLPIKVKSLRTCKSGADKNIQLEIKVNPNLTIKETHDICNQLEAKISEVILNTKIIIHPEPY